MMSPTITGLNPSQVGNTKLFKNLYDHLTHHHQLRQTDIKGLFQFITTWFPFWKFCASFLSVITTLYSSR